MTFLKNLVYKIIGKKIQGETGELDATSKAKLTAIIGVILAAIPPLSAAWGHPIEVPDYVYKILAASGLWAIRDSIK